MLFGAEEISDGRTAGLLLLATTIGGIVTTLVQFIWNWIGQSRADAKEEKKSVVDHLTERVSRLEMEKSNSENRNNKMDRRLRRTEHSNTQMLAHILYVERLLRVAKTEFEPYKEIPLPDDHDDNLDTPAQPSPGSDTHRALPSSGGS